MGSHSTSLLTGSSVLLVLGIVQACCSTLGARLCLGSHSRSLLTGLIQIDESMNDAALIDDC